MSPHQSDQGGADPAEVLPLEILEKILLYLDLPSIAELSICNRTWYNLVNSSNVIWKNLCRIYGIELKRSEKSLSWKVSKGEKLMDVDCTCISINIDFGST